MACGLPALATGWGGHTEFFTQDNGYPVDYTLVPAQAKCPYYRGFQWAEPDTDHLADRMRHVFENRAEAQAMGARAASEALQTWTWRQAAVRIRNRIVSIHEALA